MQTRCAGLERCSRNAASQLYYRVQRTASRTAAQHRPWAAIIQRQLRPGQLRLCIWQQRRVAPRAAAATTVAAAAVATVPVAAGPVAQGLLTGLVHAWHANPSHVLLAAGAFVLGISLSVFLLAAIPGILAMRRTALAMEALLHTVRQEVPDTASTLRLSGLELADCIEEVSMLSNDLTQGLRSSARAVSAAEQGVRQGVDLAGKAVTGYVVPKIKSTVPEARDALQTVLEERARLDYTAATIRELASTTKTAAQRLRTGLAALGLARGAARAVETVRRMAAERQDGVRQRGSSGRVAEGTHGKQSVEWED